MRYIVFSLMVPFCLGFMPEKTTADEVEPKYSRSSPLLLSKDTNESFYITATRLVQEQINLIARIEQAIFNPNPNGVRAVRGQLIIQAHAVERFLARQHHNPKVLCNLSPSSRISPQTENESASQAQIYCSVYASSQELLKLAPELDVLLSRRGESALVRELPLVSSERQSDPVLSITPVQRPNLDKPATPFAIQEPKLPPVPPPVVGRTAKKFLADYVPPMQPAIAPSKHALATLEAARLLLAKGITAFPAGTKFQNPQETSAVLDRFAYDLDPQESQTYHRFLQIPNTGIFRVLPYTAYLRPLNNLQNRLHRSVSERYPFPSLGDAKGGFIPSLPLQIVADNFQLLSSGVDYSFMVDVGDIPLEKLDASLKSVSLQMRQFFLNYQPPKQLEALQVERRRFITGKDQHWNQSQVILASAKAELNHTYLVRTLQFQLPEVILSGRPISHQERIRLDQLLELQGSDMIVAFRPVRHRSDGSYTVLWRILKQFDDPQIENLQEYVKFVS